MKFEIHSFVIDVLPDTENFNWAKISFSQPLDWGEDVKMEVEVRIPKTITDLAEIRSYALERIRNLDLKEAI